MDVEEPGTSAPSSTSKPVIVTNRPILKDPMVVEATDEKADKPAEKTDAAVRGSSGKPKLEPLTAPTLAEDENEDVSPKKPKAVDSPKTDDKPEDESADTGEPVVNQAPAAEAETTPTPPEPETSDQSEPETEKTANEVSDVDSQTDDKSDEGPKASDNTPVKDNEQPQESKSINDIEKKLQAEAAEQAKHDAATQKLVDSKKYFLPINAVEKRKTKRFIVLGILLVILLALAWGDIAADAGIIHVSGIKPPTHFFSN